MNGQQEAIVQELDRIERRLNSLHDECSAALLRAIAICEEAARPRATGERSPDTTSQSNGR